MTLTPEQVDAILPRPPEKPPPHRTPVARVDAFRGWTLLAAFLIVYPLGHSIVTKGFGTSWTSNAYNAVFLALALLLHGHPLSFLRACRDGASPAGRMVPSARRLRTLIHRVGSPRAAGGRVAC